MLKKILTKLKNIFTQKKLSQSTNQPVCNICGGSEFVPGPGGRGGRNGINPACGQCYSLERHRIIRKIYSHIPIELLNTMTALQISDDVSIDDAWFLSVEKSIYGKENSIDIQNIDRPDENYDIVVCNHVLEHVEDDKRAFKELLRIVKESGFLQITVPAPLQKPKTIEYGYAKDDEHGHWRFYGADFLDIFKPISLNSYVIEVYGIDEVTDAEDVVYFFCKSKRTYDKLSSYLKPFFKSK